MGTPPAGGRRSRDERGAVAILSALITLTLLVVSALVVDLGTTWLRRGELQEQADKAALFAAAALPATDDTTRMRVARRAAYYLACYPVPGQRTLDPSIPACPGGASTTSAPGLTAFAQHLLDTGAVTFPSSTQVQVVTPRAKVEYAFAGATGVEATEQVKAATAKVSSPGEILPVGLSLNCLAGIVNDAGLGSTVDGVLPISYVTAGSTGSSGSLPTDSEPVFGGWESTYTGTNASAAVTVTNPVSNGTTLTLSVGAPVSLTLSNLVSGAKVAFKRGSTPAVVSTASSITSAGTLVTTIPATVLSTPGVWHVKVQLYTSGLVLGTQPRWSALDVQFSVFPSADTVTGRLRTAVSSMLDMHDLLACGRPLDSPRTQDGGTPALTRNLQEDLDHPLTANEALVQALGTQDLSLLDGSASRLATVLQGAVQSILANPMYGLTGCAGSTYNRLDTQATYDATQSAGGAPANCVRINATAQTEDELTAGLLKTTPSSSIEPGYGRLSCARQGACTGRTTTLPGFSGTFNDDAFPDFAQGWPGHDPGQQPRVRPRHLPAPRGAGRHAVGRARPRALPVGAVRLGSGAQLRRPGRLRRAGLPDPHVPADLPRQRRRPRPRHRGAGRGEGGRRPAGAPAEEAAGARSTRRAPASACSGPRSTACSGRWASTSALADLGNLDVDAALDALTSSLGLDLGHEEAGLLLQGGKVKATRFMTIAPSALPAVDSDYQGPVTDYLGVGPKIVRLVR